MSNCSLHWCLLQVERCTQLKAQLKESEEKSQWMTNHVEDIKMQLRQTHQGAKWQGMHICHILVSTLNLQISLANFLFPFFYGAQRFHSISISLSFFFSYFLSVYMCVYVCVCAFA